MRKLLLLSLVALGLVAPTAADAAVRSITITDPNDAQPVLSGQQNEDVRTATLSYDDAGTVTLAVSFYASLNGSPNDISITADLAGRRSEFSDGCDILDPNSASVFVSPKSSYASLSLEGFGGSLSGAVVLSADGSSFTATFSNPALANRNFRCGSVGDLFTSFYTYSYCDFAGCPRSSLTIDELTPGRWFDGYAPACDDKVDNDGDGKTDRADATCKDSPYGTTEGAPNAAPRLSSFTARVLTVDGKRYLNGRVRLCDDRTGRVALKLTQYRDASVSKPGVSYRWIVVQPGACKQLAFTWPLVGTKARTIRLALAASDSSGLSMTLSRNLSIPK